MKNMKKPLALFLAMLMLISVMTSFSVLTVSAEETTAPESGTETGKENGNDRIDYLNEVFATPEDKLATMKPMTTKGNYQLYADEASGEVAVKDLRSGQVLFTNPYDIGATKPTESVKNKLLSQVIVKFSENGREKEYNSYEYAAVRDQIKVKNIKNGIRVEYTIGREEARHLVPRMIEKERFLTMIQAPMEEYYDITLEEAVNIKNKPNDPKQAQAFYLRKWIAYYSFKSLEACETERLKADMLETFPITAKMDIYVLDPTIKVTEVEKIEEVIKSACPNYTYEEMDYDHQLTEYTSEDENPPVFKLALEYTLGSDGFTVRLPANGIRFNESKFQMTNVSVLPYMGAGNNAYTGYTFFPDGSGALFAFEDMVKSNTTSVASKVYGVDYAYHQISGTYQQTVRYPVFGIVENTRYYDCVTFDEDLGQNVVRRINGMIYDQIQEDIKNGNSASPLYKKFGKMLAESEVEEVIENRGYVAIIEEGDALTELVNYHAGVLAPYDSVQMNFTPRPKDSYNLQDAISVGTNNEWTVVSDRKYVGNYKIHYRMLTDDKLAEKNEISGNEYYPATWLGMAFAYRDYLTDQGILNKLDPKRTSGDIPMYIESFGSLKTVEKIMSIPVNVKRPLTSAEDVKTMYEELSGKGVTNINFKLTGYANGGMYAKMPYGLKWEKSVSKEMTMEELFDYAAHLEKGHLGLFPEFEFSYSKVDRAFDGLSMRKHAVKTIDDRYTSKRQYYATQQKYKGFYEMAISPAYFAHFYEKFMGQYLSYDNLTGISVGSLGSALNSDFDEDEPYNREDSKSFVTKALSYIQGKDETKLDVMVDGGNAFTWKYVDHILGAPLDSSRYIKASYSVPFLGVVLHGYKNFAGSPLNMEGDLNYAKLKAIENGASVYFTLSYQNTQKLKEDFLLSQYYSIRYDIWFDDVVEIYNELNRELKDVQDKIIVGHEFLSGMRVPDIDELNRDINEEFDSILDFQNNKAEYEKKQQAAAVADARDKIASGEKAARDFVTDCLKFYSGIEGAASKYVIGDRSFEIAFAGFIESKAAYDKAMEEYKAADEEGKKELSKMVAAAEADYRQKLSWTNAHIRTISRSIATIEAEYAALLQLKEDALAGQILIQSTEGCPSSILQDIDEQLKKTEKLMEQVVGVKFDLTVDKAEVDTFFRTHIATLLIGSFGTNNANSFGIVGKAENLYNMISTGAFGLSKTEMAILRYLPANRDKTDDQLIAEYGLTDGFNTDLTGLIHYARQLLGDKYKFDPLVARDEASINKEIENYFIYMLHTTLNGMSDSSVVPTLNYVLTRLNEKGHEVSNASNIKVVNMAIKSAVEKVLTGKKGAIADVTDGNYALDKVISEADLNKLVDDVVEIINKHIKTKENPAPENPIEYATPETMRADVLAHIEGMYYKAALSMICTAPEATLHILTVPYKTDATLAMLLEQQMPTYGNVNENSFKEMYDAMKNDTFAKDILDDIAADLTTVYGAGVREQLQAAYEQIFIQALLQNLKMPEFHVINAPEPEKKPTPNRDATTKLNEAVEALFAGKKSSELTVAQADALIAEVVALAKSDPAYIFEEGTDLNAIASDIVYFVVLNKQSEASVTSFFYDKQMGTMDAAVRKVVDAQISVLTTKLGDGTVYDLYEIILAALSDKEDPVIASMKKIADEITYRADGKGSISHDVLAYYCYLLFNGFDGYQLGDEVPTVPIQGNKTQIKNGMKVLKKYMDDRIPVILEKAKEGFKHGEIPDYSLTHVMTAEQFDEEINDLFELLLTNKYAKEDERETFLPALKDYFCHVYYTAVLEKLDAVKAPTFHVAEIYSDKLFDASQGIKNLLRYFVTTLTDITEEDIDKLIGGNIRVEEEEEEEEESRYLSDDGRIVAVTYGDKDADGNYSYYKTFILNYNNFSVNVTYNEVTYTIPAYGYVVVMH